jgi:BirA family biotin operon repressor/biotin-[acetyl-CoA-carboxylase] ligase
LSIDHVPETGSTNADLLVAASEGRQEGAVLVADHQTAGRGRQARSWHDEPGNAMLMSVLLRPELALAPVVPLVAGLAVIDAIERLAGGGAASGANLVGLKWPNDVLAPALDERKLAGILAEATTGGGATGSSRSLAVVVGIGLNLRWSSPPPAEIAARAATLGELLGADVERFTVVRAVLRELDRWLDRAALAGVAGVLDTYRRRCLTLGRQVRLQTPAGVVTGTATGVDASGALLVDGDGGRVTVTAGDAHHL